MQLCKLKWELLWVERRKLVLRSQPPPRILAAFCDGLMLPPKRKHMQEQALLVHI
jgi:hypothetical protein